MCGPAHHLSNRDSVESLVHNDGALGCIDLERLHLNYLHLFVVELDHVVHDEVEARLENLHGAHEATDGVVENVGVLGSEVIEDVVGLVFLGEVQGTRAKDKTILVPELASEFATLLIILEDPDLSGEPDGATQRELVFEEFLHQNDAGYWLVLKDALKDKCQLL